MISSFNRSAHLTATFIGHDAKWNSRPAGIVLFPFLFKTVRKLNSAMLIAAINRRALFAAAIIIYTNRNVKCERTTVANTFSLFPSSDAWLLLPSKVAIEYVNKITNQFAVATGKHIPTIASWASRDVDRGIWLQRSTWELADDLNSHRQTICIEERKSLQRFSDNCEETTSSLSASHFQFKFHWGGLILK